MKTWKTTFAVVCGGILMSGQVFAEIAKTKESFDSIETLTVQKGYKCPEATGVLNVEKKKEGKASLQVKYVGSEQVYGVAYVNKKLSKAIDITGKTFEVWVMPLNEDSGYWGINFIDKDGNMVERHRVYSLKLNQWNKLTFEQGEKIKYGWFEKHDGDPKKVKTIQFRAQTKHYGVAGEDLWDNFSIK